MRQIEGQFLSDLARYLKLTVLKILIRLDAKGIIDATAHYKAQHLLFQFPYHTPEGIYPLQLLPKSQ